MSKNKPINTNSSAPKSITPKQKIDLGRGSLKPTNLKPPKKS